jgi:hypothetical protein
MSLDKKQRRREFETWKAERKGHCVSAPNDELLWDLWSSARVAAIDECIDTVNARVNSLFSDNRIHDSAEAMRCAGALRQLKL